jgi:hypothetical protein
LRKFLGIDKILVNLEFAPKEGRIEVGGVRDDIDVDSEVVELTVYMDYSNFGSYSTER